MIGWQILFGIQIFTLGFIIGGCVARKVFEKED